ncbi:hypothetical protein Csa_010353 [Cucumis sativus]|uniref:Uncharacterized protein n=1 Tax=Cucumis sativus TaxID=3659 RepID=A0A0A0L7E8_CUCSA|nr:hypothetical protein Csa_010353 [Cucumis sativus]
MGKEVDVDVVPNGKWRQFVYAPLPAQQDEADVSSCHGVCHATNMDPPLSF